MQYKVAGDVEHLNLLATASQIVILLLVFCVRKQYIISATVNPLYLRRNVRVLLICNVPPHNQMINQQTSIVAYCTYMYRL